MRAITSGELERARHEAEAKLISTCTIQTATTTQSSGSWVVSYADTYTSVPCYLASNSLAGQMDTSGERLKVLSSWILSLHWDQAIAPGNRVVLNSDTFDVVGVVDDSDNRILRRAALARRDN